MFIIIVAVFIFFVLDEIVKKEDTPTHTQSMSTPTQSEPTPEPKNPDYGKKVLDIYIILLHKIASFYQLKHHGSSSEVYHLLSKKYAGSNTIVLDFYEGDYWGIQTYTRPTKQQKQEFIKNNATLLSDLNYFYGMCREHHTNIDRWERDYCKGMMPKELLNFYQELTYKTKTTNL